MQVGSGRPDPTLKLSADLYDIYHYCVYSEKRLIIDKRNCQKHIEFYTKNKFEKLVHLVGFIITTYHDARSPERHICNFVKAMLILLITLNVGTDYGEKLR